MKTNLECIPCIIRQTVDTVRYSTDDPNLQRAVVNRVLHFLYNASLEVTPPELGKKVYHIISNNTRNKDPYREMKHSYNQSALEIYDDLSKLIDQDSNPLEMAAKLAIMGNIIDYGVTNNPISIQQVITDSKKIEFSINHLDYLLKDLRRDTNILYLADNAGEIVFDKLLLETFRHSFPGKEFNITVVVRGGPIIDDATKEDAEFTRMNEVARVIDNGDDTPGTLLKYVSDEMRKYYDQAELIISKGQGNYETLDQEKKLMYFLLKVKCPIIAKNICAKEGDTVLKCNKYD